VPSLAQAGIGGALPPFVRAADIEDRPFWILSGRINPNGYEGRPEVVLRCRLDTRIPGYEPLYLPDLGEIVDFSWSGQPAPSREEIVEYFRSNRAPLGPVMFQFLESRSGNPFANIVDYVPTTQAIAPTPARRGPVPNAAPAQPATSARASRMHPVSPGGNAARRASGNGVGGSRGQVTTAEPTWSNPDEPDVPDDYDAALPF
jgi:hypothetical protein